MTNTATEITHPPAKGPKSTAVVLAHTGVELAGIAAVATLAGTGHMNATAAIGVIGALAGVSASAASSIVSAIGSALAKL